MAGEMAHWNGVGACNGFGVFHASVGWHCRRPGCPHRRLQHRGDPRDHGFCCSACRHGEKRNGEIAHTSNCTGRGGLHVPSVAVGHRRQGYRSYGAGVSLVQEEIVRSIFFMPPASWVCWSGNVARHVHWYMVEYEEVGIGFEGNANIMWSMVEAMLSAVARTRDLEIIAIPEDVMLDGDTCVVDLRDLSIDGTSRAYNLGKVTGLDTIVQANVLVQRDTAYAVLMAIIEIERRDVSRCYIRCAGGTHRSPAVACLLGTIVYIHARIGLVTSRTQRAAYGAGWKRCDAASVGSVQPAV